MQDQHAQIIHLSPSWRVRPLEHLQWAVERRQIAKAGRLEQHTARWVPWAYCRSKAGLETAVSRLRSEGIELDPTPISDFPSFFPENNPTTLPAPIDTVVTTDLEVPE
jgi:hypothetical protein